jgi:ribonuclease HI
VTELAAQLPKGSGPTPGFYVLKTDGGITAEPGKGSGLAAIGVVLKDPKYRDVAEVSREIGWARSHHVAEFEALIDGLKLARHHGIDLIRVFLDSALVVNTVNGDSKLKAVHLRDLYTTACALVEKFADIKMCWVPREMNVEADALASRALGRSRARGVPDKMFDG